MNAKEKIEELLEASEDGTITAAQVTEAGLHRSVLQEFVKSGEMLKQENLIVKRVVPENYEFGRIEIESPSGNPIRVYDLERTLCDILRGSGSDVQIVGEAMKRYAASKDKNIHKLMQYADQLRVKPKVLRYMEVLL